MSAPAAVRALGILKALASASAPLSATAIAERVGAPRASTYRLLEAMEGQGFVVHYPQDGRWGLGVATFEVGSAYLRRQPLELHGMPVLARLVAQSRRTAHLGVLEGAEVLYLLVQRPRRPDPLVTEVGVRLPAHRTASGRAILARLPKEQVRAAYSRTGVPADLADLDVDRRRGWSCEHGLVTPGYSSVASPVLDGTGRAVAAVSLTWPQDSLADLESHLPAVRAAAANLTRRLGGVAPAG